MVVYDGLYDVLLDILCTIHYYGCVIHDIARLWGFDWKFKPLILVIPLTYTHI